MRVYTSVLNADPSPIVCQLTEVPAYSMLALLCFVQDGYTPVMIACDRGREGVVNLLLERGANVVWKGYVSYLLDHLT